MLSSRLTCCQLLTRSKLSFSLETKKSLCQQNRLGWCVRTMRGKFFCVVEKAKTENLLTFSIPSTTNNYSKSHGVQR